MEIFLWKGWISLVLFNKFFQDGRLFKEQESYQVSKFEQQAAPLSRTGTVRVGFESMQESLVEDFNLRMVIELFSIQKLFYMTQQHQFHQLRKNWFVN